MLHIRAAVPEDASALLAIYAPYVKNTAITFEYEVPTETEFRERICEVLEKYPYLVAEDDGRIVGYAYGHPFRARAAYAWAAEVSIYLDAGCRGQGLGRRLYEALEAVLKAQGVRSLCACITLSREENDPTLTDASPRFHAKLGYTKVAHFHGCGCKFGKWYDMIWMEKRIGDYAENPVPILPFAAVRERFGY